MTILYLYLAMSFGAVIGFFTAALMCIARDSDSCERGR